MRRSEFRCSCGHAHELHADGRCRGYRGQRRCECTPPVDRGEHEDRAA